MLWTGEKEWRSWQAGKKGQSVIVYLFLFVLIGLCLLCGDQIFARPQLSHEMLRDTPSLWW